MRRPSVNKIVRVSGGADSDKSGCFRSVSSASSRVVEKKCNYDQIIPSHETDALPDEEPGASFTKGLRDANKRTLLRLHKAGHLSKASFEELVVLPSGEIGQQGWRALGVPEEIKDRKQILSTEQLQRIVESLRNRPRRYHTLWMALARQLQRNLKNGEPVTVGFIQNRVLDAKKRHLQAMIRCLKLLQLSDAQKWHVNGLPGRKFKRWFFPLFGIPYCCLDTTSLRPWDAPKPDKSGDAGIAVEIQQLKNGHLIFGLMAALENGKHELLRCKLDSFMILKDVLAGWLIYLTDQHGIMTKVEAVFDFGFPLQNMSRPKEEATIRDLCHGLSGYIGDATSGCYEGPDFCAL